MIGFAWHAVWAGFLNGSFWYPAAFYLCAFGVLISALFVVLSGNIVRSALWLLPCLASAAGLFLLLGAEFLAAMQILVCCGGVLVFVLLAIMVTRGIGRSDTRTHHQQFWWGLLAVSALGGVTVYMLRGEVWSLAPAVPSGDATERLADALLTSHVLAFEVAAVILLVAMVGAIMIARQEPRQ
jgi:NADH-quinone oxidoreductase subunit J